MNHRGLGPHEESLWPWTPATSHLICYSAYNLDFISTDTVLVPGTGVFPEQSHLWLLLQVGEQYYIWSNFICHTEGSSLQASPYK